MGKVSFYPDGCGSNSIGDIARVLVESLDYPNTQKSYHYAIGRKDYFGSTVTTVLVTFNNRKTPGICISGVFLFIEQFVIQGQIVGIFLDTINVLCSFLSRCW